MLRETLARGTYRHGMSGTRTWKAWMKMRARCRIRSEQRYPNYGGRGIKVCERWNVFENFLADMGEAPEGMTIERIDVNGHYTPENCRWATADEQYSNTTRTVFVTFHGRRVPFRDLVKAAGIKYATASARVFRYGWPAERAFPNLRPEQLHGSGPGTPPRP